MGYWISKLKSLPNIFDWYFFLIGDYRNRSLINDVFRDDFCVIAERLSVAAAIISQNNLLERDLQESLKRIKGGKLGAFLSDLEEQKPGLLIINKHPSDLYNFNTNTPIKESQKSVPVIIYIPFETLEFAYASSNTLIADIVSFSKNQNENLIKKTAKFGCIKDIIDTDILKSKKFGAVTISYEDRDTVSSNFTYFDNNQKNSEHSIKDTENYNRKVICPFCSVQMNVKGMSQIKVQGNNHEEVLEVASELYNRSYELYNGERKKNMEKILIIAALEKELQPILESIDSPLKQKNIEVVNGRKYFIYGITSTLTVICTSFLGMGQLNASIAVKDAINYYGVNKVILTGICGGIDKNMNYGDIIISDQIVDYELAKIKEDNIQVRWNVYRSDYELIQGMMMFKSDEWLSYLKRAFPSIKNQKPNVYSGIVLSGNKVISSCEEIKQFKKIWIKALAVEMEASGIAAVLHQMKNAPSFVMVKAICDFADSEKNDDWQEYAANVSAVFVLNYIFTECNHFEKKSEFGRDAITSHSCRCQKLFSAIMGTYNIHEINVLAFNIGVDIEDVGGWSKSEKVVELIRYCQRRNIIDKLINQINIERNNLLID